MPDREKLITGLRDLRRYLEDKEWSDKRAGAYFETVTEAISVLKEQEPIPCGEKIKAGDVVLDFYKCGYCKNAIRKPWRYCPFCGKSVKWKWV